MSQTHFARSQRMTIVLGIALLCVMLVVMQLWLLTATMEAYLDGEQAIVVPAALASLGCFALNLGLFRFLRALDR
jgi:hypothetical protein